MDGVNGDDRLFGGAGNDCLHGGPQADVLIGREGDDHLVGHFGDDRIVGRDGHDWIRVGRGADTIVFEDGFGMGMVYDFDLTEDRIGFAASAAVQSVADLTLIYDGVASAVVERVGSDALKL